LDFKFFVGDFACGVGFRPAVLNWGCEMRLLGVRTSPIIQKTMPQNVQGVQKWFFLPDRVRASKWIENHCFRPFWLRYPALGANCKKEFFDSSFYWNL